jgi:hypothetical protein
VDLLQTWLIVGVPAMLFTLALLAGKSQLRSMAAYLVLAILVVVFLTVPDEYPGSVISAAAVGLIGFFLVATGRGTAADDAPEHQQTRGRYTHASHD